MIDSTSRLEFFVTGLECFVAQRNVYLTTYGDLVSLQNMPLIILYWISVELTLYRWAINWKRKLVHCLKRRQDCFSSCKSS